MGLIFFGIALALWSRTAESVAVLEVADICGWSKTDVQVKHIGYNPNPNPNWIHIGYPYH